MHISAISVNTDILRGELPHYSRVSFFTSAVGNKIHTSIQLSVLIWYIREI